MDPVSHVKYTESVHLIEQQHAAEEAFLRKFHAGSYTVSSPLTILNPYIIAPLSAVVLFRTETETPVTVTVSGKSPEGDISHSFPAAKEHILPIFGLYAGCENTVSLRTGNGETGTVTILTAPAPEIVKQPTSICTTPEYLNGDLMFVSPATTAATAAYDYAGECRWYTNLILGFDIRRLKNGNFLVSTERLFASPYHLVGLWELSLSGKIIKEFTLPGGYHHDTFEMEDGNLLVLTSEFESGTDEDICVLIDRETGSIIRRWDIKDYIDPSLLKNAGSSEKSAHSWYRNNALYYDKNTDTLLLGGRFSQVVINIDFAGTKLNWVLGDPTGWPEDFVSRYFFKPADDGRDFEWFYEPHACSVTPEGDILLFDNGHYRPDENRVPRNAANNYSRAVVYSIDTDSMSVSQQWQFGKERGSAFFSPYISNTFCYAPGHFMVHSGGICYVNGIPSDTISTVLDFTDPSVLLDACTVEIEDGCIKYEMHLPASFYRAYRSPLYTENTVLIPGAGLHLGTLGETACFDVGIDDAIAANEPIPEHYKLEIQNEYDRFSMFATFEQGQLVMLVLENENDAKDKRFYFISTSKQTDSTMCVATYFNKEARSIWFPLNKEGLNARYRMLLIIDGVQYDLGITI